MQPKKCTKITDSSGWTHIVHGPSNAIHTKYIGSHNKTQRTPDSTPLDQVSENHARYLDLWKKSDCWRRLADFIQNTVVQRKDLRLTKCICLGLGSVSAGRVSSKHELAALVTILCLLEKFHHIESVVFQDPAFNDVDTAFFTKLGYSVVPTPVGFNSIDNTTFCFAPHLENEIFAMALQNVHPALCIGNGGILNDRPLHSSATTSQDVLEVFRRFAEVTGSQKLPEYDEDPWCQFTNIYWLLEDTE